jgi:hypothetical protein
MDDETRAARFNEVRQREWEQIEERRSRQLYSGGEGNSHQPPQNLVGLALSGGGIRSATFCLGLLQGMDKLKLLRIFDYLSTVSGGGYVGGWWSAWLAREEVNPKAGRDTPFLRPEDIKNLTHLAIKLRGGEDLISQNLYERLSAKTKRLLIRLNDGESPSDELRAVLVSDLNLAIADNFFYAPWYARLPGKKLKEISGREKQSLEGSDEDYAALAERLTSRLRINRALLEEAYSYEIYDMFPPRERIESERPRNALPEPGKKEVEGAASAWRDPVHHLRLFASYLTPRKGMLSADTWRAVSVVTRNLTLTWLILLPVLIAIVLAGQLYFQVMHDFNNLSARISTPVDIPLLDIFLSGRFNAAERLAYLAIPVAALLGWIIWIAVLWLVFSTDRFTINGLIIQFVCLGAVGTLIYSCLTIHPPLSNALVQWWQTPGVQVGLSVWGAAALFLTIWAIKPPSARDMPEDKYSIKTEWKRQVRRNRISRIHTKLMITLAVVFIVLLFSGFGHWALDKLLHISTPTFPIALLPVISALGGSIFTAFKSTPTGGGDKFQAREPSAVSRFIFAVTPGMMVVVLAVGAAWLGDELLGHISKDLQTQQLGLLLKVAIFYGIFLCFALAVYEMSWRELRPSWSLLAFSCLVVFNVSWAVRKITSFKYTFESHKWLSLIPSFVAAAILVIAFTRIFGNRRWRRSLEKIKKFQGPPNQVSTLILILVGFAWALAASWRKGRQLPQNITILMVAIAVLAGGLILFRLAVTRKGAAQKFELKKPLRAGLVGRSTESLWWLASLCLAMPVLAGGVLHTILPFDKRHRWWQEILMTILLALLVAILPQILILFRKAAILEKGREVKPVSPLPDLEGAQKAALTPGFLERAVSKLPWISTQPQHSFRMIACYAVGFGVVAGFTTPVLGGTVGSQQSVTFPLSLPAIIVAFVLSLIIFELAVVRMPLDQAAEAQPLKIANYRWLREHNKGFLWMLAGACMLIAFLIGYLLNISLGHLGREPVRHNPLSDIALPGLIACFTIAVFEIRWGKGNNRRTLWLLATAYGALATLFIIGLNPTYGSNYAIMRLLTVLGLLAAVLVWSVALGWMVDPNAVSMHQFYKGRLVRAYLGASNLRRFNEKKEITEAVAGDDVPLTKMKNCQRGAPYHLINTTLNLAAGRDLTTAQRSASSFVLAQSYCGSSRTLYRPTAQYMSGGLTLGAAVAASGAAVSPSMGAKKPTAALAMLMTLLNVRLGYWAPTPNRENWKQSQPRLWPFYLLREFLSQTNDLSSYCHLTDGGHFDNTGLYSLVERGCRYIVMADCGADPQPCFEDLGDAIRRCRIDFGTEIELDIEPLMKGKTESLPQSFVVGTIKYSRKHARALGWEIRAAENSDDEKKERSGFILYFKPTVAGKVTADVRQYAIENKYFPQQSTANQWFDEAQFESYRRLGQSCAEKAFSDLSATQQIKNKMMLGVAQIEAVFVEVERKYNSGKSA